MPKQLITQLVMTPSWGIQKQFIDPDTGDVFDYNPYDDNFFVNPQGERKTKAESPYGYSEFYIWRDADLTHSTGDYSDRLEQWSAEKWKAAWDAMPKNKRITEMTKRDCSKFLSVYHGRPIKAMGLIEGCNVSNGYPYWVFLYEAEPQYWPENRAKEEKRRKRNARRRHLYAMKKLEAQAHG